MDDTIFPFNAGNIPKSNTTRRPMFSQFRQAAAPEAKSAVSDCILLLTAIWPQCLQLKNFTSMIDLG